jgi:two-component system, sensor histidine kinase RegB
LREQAQRCREILAKLTQLSASSEPFDRSRLSTLIEEVVAPHRNFGVAIDVALPEDRAGEPVGEHNPAIIYGLGNLVENAVDFARERVEIAARWSDEEVVIAIADDGPGFAPEILDRIGEPYLTSRGRPQGGEGEISGLGLGVFIAKTLLERSGAVLAFANRAAPQHGAMVRVRWRREDYERAGPGIPAAAS